jgi:OmpA-OmpF porin, OOP family
MHPITRKAKAPILLAALAVAAPVAILAQQQETPEKQEIIVSGQQEDPNANINSATPVKGPEIKGIISARSGDRMQVTANDGTRTVIAITQATKVKSRSGLFSRAKLGESSLLNGLPVTVKTMNYNGELVASQINLRKGDLKTANMIRTGTAQGFAEQTAATEALRGRMGDIDEYNVKGVTNVNFATGRADISATDKAELCSTVTQAQSMKNSLILVVGYTDSVGSEEFNQQLSEKRASRVVNYIQQACGWKPYRMLTPTGMSEADPLADNTTAEGKAQNRRVAVNILVSKGLDGL